MCLKHPSCRMILNFQVSSYRKQQALNNIILGSFVAITRHANWTLFAPHCDRLCNACVCVCVCVCVCRIFRNNIVNGTILQTNFLDMKCVFWFSLRLLSETFLLQERIQSGIIIRALWSSLKVTYFRPTFNKIWRSRFVPFGPTGRQTDMKNLKLLFLRKRLKSLAPVGIQTPSP